MQQTLLKQATLGLGDVASSEYWKTLQLSGADSLRDEASKAPEKSDAPELVSRETREVMSRDVAGNFLRPIADGKWSYNLTTADMTKIVAQAGADDRRLPNDLIVDLLAAIEAKYNWNSNEFGFLRPDPERVLATARLFATLFGAAGRRLIQERGTNRYGEYCNLFVLAPFGDADPMDEALTQLQANAYRFEFIYEIFPKIREKDPRRAREHMESVWKEANRRAYLYGCYEGLSKDDVPFLESALKDRDPETRRAAGRLLAQFPDSQYAQAARTFADAILTEDGFVPPKKNKEHSKYGFVLEKNALGWKYFAPEENTAILILSVVPLAHWEERFKLSPREIAAKFPFGEKNLPVIIGWLCSCVRFGCSIEQLKVAYAYLLDLADDDNSKQSKSSPADRALRSPAACLMVPEIRAKTEPFGEPNPNFNAKFNDLVQRVAGRELVFDRAAVADWLAEK